MALTSNPWQSIHKRLPKPLQNRYYLAGLIFLMILLFVDKHDVWTQIKLRRALIRLENDRLFYQQKIKEAKEEAEDFDLTRENYAREHYFMRNANEDVFILQPAK